MFALSRFEWQVFVTLTFVREHMPESVRRRYWFSFVRVVAGNFKRHFRRVLWLLRSEHGEQTGRFHYHALIGGLTPLSLTERDCLVMMSQWEHLRPLVERIGPDGERRKLSRFCGMARIRVYSPGMDGLDYFVGCEFLTQGQFCWSPGSGANRYEAGKFGKADTVEISESCFSEMRARRSRGSAKTIQSRQSSVVPSHHSPALSSMSRAITEVNAGNQISAQAGAIQPCKSIWRPSGAGLWHRMEA